MVNRTLGLLDLQVIFHDENACWRYASTSSKRLLPYDSAHPKLVKRNIVLEVSMAAIEKPSYQ